MKYGVLFVTTIIVLLSNIVYADKKIELLKLEPKQYVRNGDIICDGLLEDELMFISSDTQISFIYIPADQYDNFVKHQQTCPDDNNCTTHDPYMIYPNLSIMKAQQYVGKQYVNLQENSRLSYIILNEDHNKTTTIMYLTDKTCTGIYSTSINSSFMLIIFIIFLSILVLFCIRRCRGHIDSSLPLSAPAPNMVQNIVPNSFSEQSQRVTINNSRNQSEIQLGSSYPGISGSAGEQPNPEVVYGPGYQPISQNPSV